MIKDDLMKHIYIILNKPDTHFTTDYPNFI